MSASRKDLERKRYRAVRNAYGDPQLAKRAMSWTDERVYKELGVHVPKREPELKTFSQAQKTRKARLYDNFRYGRQEGLEPLEAVQVKQYAKKRISATYDFLRARTGTAEERRQLWADWSKQESLPPQAHKLAKKINRTTNNRGGRLDDTDRYGYAVVFYAYTRGETIENIMKKLVVDPYDGDQYRQVYKRRR